MVEFKCRDRSDGKLDCTMPDGRVIIAQAEPNAADHRALRQRSQVQTERQAEDLQRRGVLPNVSIGACTETVLPNRTKQTTCKDGTQKIETPDGRGYIRRLSGAGETKVQTWGPTPADRCNGTQKRDGSYERQCQDGSYAKGFPTKAGWAEGSRGTRPEQNYNQLKMRDGGSVTTDQRGSVVVQLKDGTRFVLPPVKPAQAATVPYRGRRR